MESLDTAAVLMDDLLDFSSDIGEEDEVSDVIHPCEKTKKPSNHRHRHHHHSSLSLLNKSAPFPEFVEEELEWISNKDAFPMVESLVDIIPNHPSLLDSNHQSPVSVLENSSSSMNSNLSHGSNNNSNSAGTSSRNAIPNMISLINFKVPVKARSKQGRKRRRDMLGEQWQCFEKVKSASRSSNKQGKPSAAIGRKCLHCGAEKTPQWRAGPMGPKTLCNACGVRYKSGRLVPEYRPASSPTFSNELHSNSHRKILEMRRHKMVGEAEVRPAADIG